MCFLTQSLKTHLASRFPSPLCPLIIKTKLPPGSLEVTQGVEFIHLICFYILHIFATNLPAYQEKRQKSFKTGYKLHKL